MTTLEKVFIAITLLSGLAFKSLGLVRHELTVTFMALTYLSLFILIIYYMIRAGWTVYALLLASIQVGMIGTLFMIQHWPGQVPMRLLGNASLLVFSILLVRFALKEQRNNLFIYATAILLVAQVASSVSFDRQFSQIGNLLYFPLVASIGTMKLNRLNTEFGMDKVLNIILIQGILFVSSYSFQLLR